MEYGCIGEHLPHSFSKVIHAKIGAYPYDLCELAPDEVGAFLQKRDFRAINVTIPYKQTVIPYLDGISDVARRIGAVNTIVNRGGKLYGTNTDYTGLSRLLARTGVDLAGKKVLIAGTGGTSKTARAVCTDLGAREILVLSRTPGDGQISYEEALAHHTDADVLINTTPCGMFPHISGMAIDPSRFPRLSGAIDAVYNPLRSDFVQTALSVGARAAGGLYMLVSQAVAAAEVFFDKSFPAELSERVYREVLKEKRNIVLIGMPSSGKSTVGRALAEKTGAEFFDTDAELEARVGCSCADFIRSRGIDAFREEEAATVASLAPLSGVIIATGGGAVLRNENVTALRKNGVLYHLDRPFDALLSTRDRPLSDSPEKLRALYDERAPVYARARDVRIDASATPEEIVAGILKE